MPFLSLKRCFTFAQFDEGLFDEFGVLAAGCEIGMGGGPVLFGFPMPFQIPQGQSFVPIAPWLIRQVD